ncbi:hypothetical protein P9112_002720 [Eukaryota sp. TZLM1-RC]
MHKLTLDLIESTPSHLTTVRFLDLSGVFLSPRIQETLSKILPISRVISVRLVNNGLSEASNLLLSSLRAPTVRNIDLSRNGFSTTMTVSEAKRFQEVCSRSNVRVLNLTCLTSFSLSFFIYLFQGLSCNTSIQEVNLCNNFIQNKSLLNLGFSSLAKCPSLVHLSIKGSSVALSTMSVFFGAKTSIKSMVLWNCFSEPLKPLLSSIIQCKTLQNLELGNNSCRIDSEDVYSLMTGIRSLRFLGLAGVNLDKLAFISLAEALSISKLRWLDLRSNTSSLSVLKSLSCAIKFNTNLFKLTITKADFINNDLAIEANSVEEHLSGYIGIIESKCEENRNLVCEEC